MDAALHDWNLTPKQAIALQSQLAKQLEADDRIDPVTHIAGVDIGFEERDVRLRTRPLDSGDDRVDGSGERLRSGGCRRIGAAELHEADRAQAAWIGALFRAGGIATAAVYSSQWCRCLDTARLLARIEGIPGGISTGGNVAAALEVAARPEFKGKRIVTVACSFAERYISSALFEGL